MLGKVYFPKTSGFWGFQPEWAKPIPYFHLGQAPSPHLEWGSDAAQVCALPPY